MEDEAILLKIKRDFTTNEAVQSLLKIISSLEEEIGMLKSELHEAVDSLVKMRKEGGKTKKQWMKDEVFVEVTRELENTKKKSTEYKKKMEEWRNKYFSLMALTSKND